MRISRALLFGGMILALGLVGAAHSDALAQNPFGAPRAAPDSQIGGVVGWLLVKQSEFYRQISSTIRAAKTDGSAVWTLLGLSFVYGIFHAAGPGHGKAVISSYLVANEETAKRGIVLSFASALLQALVAILIVVIGAAILNVTARQMCGAERVIEIASYALIAAFGARLAWTKGSGFFKSLRVWSGRHQPALALAHAHGTSHSHDDHDHSHHHHHDRHDEHHHDHHHHAATAHASSHVHHHHGHGHDEHCGCAHGPEPSALAGPGGWTRGLSAVFTVGIRPCSGAILVMVFALSQGLLWTGIAATVLMGIGTAITVATIATLAVSAKSVARRLGSGSVGGGAVILRGLEFTAASLLLLFGVGLLLGYVAAERVTCF